MARFIVTLRRTFMWEGEAEDALEAEIKAIEDVNHPCYMMGDPIIEDIEEMTSDTTGWHANAINKLYNR